MTKVPNKALRILLYTNAAVLITGAMLGPIYAIFVEEIGGDLMDASIAGSVFALVAGITTVVSGKYSDKVKENELIVVLGYFIVSIGFLLYYWVSSVIFLFIAQAVIGLGEAIYSPVFDALYSKHIGGHKFGSQWGIWEAMNYFIMAIGSISGGFLVVLFGFKMMFVLMSGICLMSALYIYRLKRDVL